MMPDKLRVEFDVLRAQGQLPAFGHGIAGVDAQIHQHLLKLARVGFDELQVVSQHCIDFDVFSNNPAQHR